MNPMTLPNWTAVDDYIAGKLIPTDSVLDQALEASAAAGLPAIHVAPNQGKMLQLLAQIHGARTILEVGTLGGYSTIWLARALPADGKLITLELNPKNAEVARANLARAGLNKCVELRLGAAGDSMAQLAADGHGPFDLIFIDADKPNNPTYFDWALKLTRPGSLIIVDNVVRDGKVVDANSRDGAIQGTRQLYDIMSKEPRVNATAVQTVGSKGYDGFILALVIS
jgi:predicted O-methyltransferase YrrM